VTKCSLLQRGNLNAAISCCTSWSPAGSEYFTLTIQPLNMDQFIENVPAWLNFLRCSNWESTEPSVRNPCRSNPETG
jgi:hypothetical protein